MTIIKKTIGKLISVEPNGQNEKNEEWYWRKDFEGFIGLLYIRAHFDKYSILMHDDESYLRTGKGELTMDDTSIRLITKNSTYTFKYFEKADN